MINELITDYFAPGEAIAARLKDQVPEVKQFFTPTTIADMVERSQAEFAIHVLYGGDAVTRSEGANNGERAVIWQRWVVILAVRHAAAQTGGSELLLKKAGTVVPKILGSLQGWAPVGWMRPLRRSEGAPQAGYTATFAYLPFMFQGIVLT